MVVKMKIAIIGYGFVGKALHNAINKNIEVIKIDPRLGKSIKDLKNENTDFIFVCISTPMEDDGSQSIDNIAKVFKDIKEYTPDSKIILKSTVIPLNIEKLLNIDDKFIYNPEFLRENYAFEDFIESKLIVFGGDKSISKSLGNFYSNYTKCKTKKYIETDHISASLIKYTINVFLATKVIFFNEIHELFNASNTNEKWEEFTKILSIDSRIGHSHMQVPGHDGRKGFGGACLPKDLSAILNFAKSVQVDLNVLNTVNICNNNIRQSYNIKTDREIEQNISFKINKENI